MCSSDLKMGWQGQAVDGIAAAILNVVPPLSYAGDEVAARERLTPRGQPDWPVLAAAIAFDDEIWSNDRDFFGVGVPVWSTPNIQFSGLGRG